MWTPAVGPPSWAASGNGTAATRDEFDLQSQQYVAFLNGGFMAGPGPLSQLFLQGSGQGTPGVVLGTPNPPISSWGSGVINPVSTGDLVGAAASLCDLLPVAARAACKAAGGYIAGALDNRGASYSPAQACPPGTVWDGTKCAVAGVTGMVQRMLPGGQTGYAFSPTLGIYGAGVTPFTVQSMTRKCPRGHVLGNDGVCYRRGNVAKKDRAWNPGTKALLTGGDVAALNKAKRLQKSIRRLATAHGPKKPCKCGIRKGKAVKV